MLKMFLMLGSLIGLLISSSVSAATLGDQFSLSPYWDWKTIETEHFRVTFPVELSSQAQRIANLYEQAHVVLTKELIWNPPHKTQIILVDHTDSANGLTSPVSRLGMILYLTPPDTTFSTTYYDDWLKLLVFHEYAHFLNMDATRGLYSAFRILLGDVILPNSLWPAWMLEGMGVFIETKYTEKGRGRSPYYDMLARTTRTTLDRVNGTEPHFPAGETPYMYGYQLMNQAEKNKPGTLGELSLRSSSRVPYFINGNLDNIIGKDWYTMWDEYRAKIDLKTKTDQEIIRKEPVTQFETIDQTQFEALGNAVAPNDQWLAYSLETEHHWQALQLKNLKTGETKEIEDKFSGVGMAFFPDSRAIVYSSLERQKNYYLFSELKVYDIQKNSSYWLTKFQRAKDPDVSRDGKWITYTVSAKSATHLVLGKLKIDGAGRYTLDGKKILLEVPMFDRVSNPKFSADQRSIYFTLKKNKAGAGGEDLMRFDLASNRAEVLVADGFQNRFPAVDRQGVVYYISDLTGVDNLYRFQTTGPKTQQVSNFLTGMWLPSFSGSKIYGSVFTEKGWALASFNASPVMDSKKVTITAPDAPAFQPSEELNQTYEVKNYSLFPSLWPRQWAPLLVASEEGYYAGGQVFGYDAVMRHQYLAAGAYDTEAKTWDVLALYSNRVLGPTLDISYSNRTSNFIPATPAVSSTYVREMDTNASLSFPFQFTVSTLTPALGLGLERDSEYAGVSGTRRLLGKSRYVPTQDFSLMWRHTRSSRLSVKSERGQKLFAGVRRYDDSEIENYKGILKAETFYHLGNHFVLSPSVKGIMASKTNRRFLDANAVVRGREDKIFNPLPGDNFDEFQIRGYPNMGVRARRIYTGALDLDFPLAQIFRGWGTNPVFFNQLTMNAFGETTYVPSFRSATKRLTSVGAGARLTSDWLLHIPLTFSYDYHYGLNELMGGQGDSFFSIQFTGGLPF